MRALLPGSTSTLKKVKRDGRPDGLKRTAFQTENAPGHAERLVRHKKKPPRGKAAFFMSFRNAGGIAKAGGGVGKACYENRTPPTVVVMTAVTI